MGRFFDTETTVLLTSTLVKGPLCCCWYCSRGVVGIIVVVLLAFVLWCCWYYCRGIVGNVVVVLLVM